MKNIIYITLFEFVFVLQGLQKVPFLLPDLGTIRTKNAGIK